MKSKNMLQKFKFLAVLGCVALLFGGCAGAPKWLQGKWQGTGDQVDGQQWEVALDATKLRKIRIDYPDLSCGGKWELVQANETTANMKERLTYGLDKCDQNVEMVVEKLPGGKVKVMYYLKSYSPDPIATAVLTKRE